MEEGDEGGGGGTTGAWAERAHLLTPPWPTLSAGAESSHTQKALGRHISALCSAASACPTSPRPAQRLTNFLRAKKSDFSSCWTVRRAASARLRSEQTHDSTLRLTALASFRQPKT
ncbi:hypothetical protein L1887_57359 [Cichorium endivia]|nr:hypothetical protein L1887_57359 [Cichorium endivia]